MKEAVKTEDLKVIHATRTTKSSKPSARLSSRKLKSTSRARGAHTVQSFWEIESLECNAWNEVAGPELSRYDRY